jgi:hypothetical protein
MRLFSWRIFHYCHLRQCRSGQFTENPTFSGTMEQNIPSPLAGSGAPYRFGRPRGRLAGIAGTNSSVFRRGIHLPRTTLCYRPQPGQSGPRTGTALSSPPPCLRQPWSSPRAPAYQASPRMPLRLSRASHSRRSFAESIQLVWPDHQHTTQEGRATLGAGCLSVHGVPFMALLSSELSARYLDSALDPLGVASSRPD